MTEFPGKTGKIEIEEQAANRDPGIVVSILQLTAWAALLSICAWSHAARGDLVGVEYWDEGVANPDASGGPLWTGVVDTVTNNLRIDTWEELPLHGAEFWLPANLPIVWEARDSSGGLYDVPDTFGPTIGGSVMIDDTFAFISRVSAQDMQWEDINGDPVAMGGIWPPTRPGWGGFAAIEELGGAFVFHTAAVVSEVGPEPDYDETTMPRLPVNINTMLASTAALVEVTSRVVTSEGVITGIPEPSAFLAVGLFFSICVVGRKIIYRVCSERAGTLIDILD